MLQQKNIYILKKKNVFINSMIPSIFVHPHFMLHAIPKFGGVVYKQQG